MSYASLRDEDDSLELVTFSGLESLKIGAFLKPDIKWRLGDLSKDLGIGSIHYATDYEDLYSHMEMAETKPFDAVLIDIVGCQAFGLEYIYKICKGSVDRPVVAIGDLGEESWNHKIINLGVTDLIPLEEVSQSIVSRVLKHAVVRNRNLQKFRAFEERHKGIVDNATEGIFQTTVEGKYILANPALARLYGYGSPQHLMDDLTSIDTQLYVDKGRREDFQRLMTENGKVVNFESRIRRLDGKVIWISENARVVESRDGTVAYYEGFVRDITQEKTRQEQLEFLAQRDHLTGLPNRALYQERLNDAIIQAEQQGTRFGLFFVDLDDFKKINDTMGHYVGDCVLEIVAKRLVSIIGLEDTVARLSGDEFTLLMKSVQSRQQAETLARKIMDVLASPFQVGTRQFFTSGSVGICLFPDHGQTLSELMQNVDSAAYHAKKQGRDSYLFYSQSISQSALRRLELENGLRTALENEEFELYFQPKVSMQTSRIIGSEALLRWTSKDLGPVSPDEFIPAAEDTGLIVQIGNWVIKQACVQQSEWIDQGLLPGTVAVNLSGRQFYQAGLDDYIKQVLEETALSPHCLELELTESALVEHVKEAVSILEVMASLGVKSTVDDFGTGYSSLSYLKKFPISTLKVDRSFVMDLPDDSEDAAIVRAIISLGQSLDLEIVAEGIENVAQHTFLKALNCTYAQGFAFSKPLSANDFQKLLENSDTLQINA